MWMCPKGMVSVAVVLWAATVHTSTAFQATPFSVKPPAASNRVAWNSAPHVHGSNMAAFVSKKQSPLLLFLATEDEDESPPYFKGDTLIGDASRALKRVSWLSWWSQVILTTVSSVTLLFARNVLLRTTNPVEKGVDGFFLAGCGIVTSFLSIFWTWGGARLSRRLIGRDKKNNNNNAMTRIRAAHMLRRCIRGSVYLNLIGIFGTLVGAEQIVGMLAIKVLTMQGVIGTTGSAAVATQTLQPLDILIVQANTNTLLSHFSSLVLALYLVQFVEKLDPPSIENDERKRN